MPPPSPTDWEKRLKALSGSALSVIRAAGSLDKLEAERLRLLGRKGELTALLKKLKDLPLDDRKRLGPETNRLKGEITDAIGKRRLALQYEKTNRDIAGTRIDASLPAVPAPRGRPHPLTQTTREMTAVLSRLGFTWADGPLVETDHYNFGALGIPPDHPARDMQDTFYLDSDVPLLMRTHTSPVQIRWMEKHKPPIRIMAPGRVFRHEAVDATHSAVFNQIEGLYVDKNVSMADLKSTLDQFMKALFGPKTKIRFRPSYFPFTEPSAEVDVLFKKASGETDWLEMLGCGIVNPAVLRNVGIDPESYSGYAFGVGIERIAMVVHGIPDIRMFYENDLRFLEQFEG